MYYVAPVLRLRFNSEGKMTVGDTNELARLQKALEVFIEIDPFMTAQRIHTLLAVATEEMGTMAEVRQYYTDRGLSNSTSMRNLSFWTDQTWIQPDGKRPVNYKAITYIQDPSDYRAKLLKVTPEGNNLLSKVVSELKED